MSSVKLSPRVAVAALLLVSSQHAFAQSSSSRGPTGRLYTSRDVSARPHTSRNASAQPTVRVERQVQGEVSAATADVARRLSELEQTVDQRPEQVNPSRWTSILAGAEEVKCKAAALNAQRSKVKETVLALSEASGRMRSGLAGLEQKFVSLADAAQAEADGSSGQPPLPEQLREMVQREVRIYRDAAVVCKDTGTYLSTTLADTLASQKESVGLLDQCGPMLERLENAADNFIELAKIGQEVEEAKIALEEFANEINGVLDLFEQLNSSTKEAISKVARTNNGRIAVTVPTLEKARSRAGDSLPRTAEVIRGTTTARKTSNSGNAAEMHRRNSKLDGAYTVAGSKYGAYRYQRDLDLGR